LPLKEVNPEDDTHMPFTHIPDAQLLFAEQAEPSTFLPELPDALPELPDALPELPELPEPL
jgi:hypothetical protein